MFRLVALTLGGLVSTLLLYGNPDTAEAETGGAVVAAAASPQYPWGVIAASIRTDAPAEAPLDHAELTRRAMAAATQPGTGEGVPKLRPSPERARAAAPEQRLASGPALYVIGDAVNLRAAPGGGVVGSLTRGAAVTSVGPTSGGWIEIEAADGSRGFMSAQFLSPRQPG
ncbi:SH3 domain-containing protein [Paracoccus sp. S-4012]|uniref:SH3 domain-containing protein n=1 Tax=Paracoccus sp. S-4012 TaxID=2665648 RepID=UPI0012AF8928|nr:SH3 domain-containing protein [Paracoccus sp. S-4012]MRX50975.1 SH3 domain-containing protein [Paracoccus sp. S-4012]